MLVVIFCIFPHFAKIFILIIESVIDYHRSNIMEITQDSVAETKTCFSAWFVGRASDRHW